jgi:hypothetical protein
VPILAGVALLFVPVSEGLKPNAWYYFALFVAVVIALILEPIPAAGGPRRRHGSHRLDARCAEPADAIKWGISASVT